MRIIDQMIERMADTKRATTIGEEATKVIEELSQVPGITQASSRDLKDSLNLFKLRDGTIVSRYTNPAKFEHVFLSNAQGEFIYGGYVGWIHNAGLLQKIEEIRQTYAMN
jgi:hypothetical protein